MRQGVEKVTRARVQLIAILPCRPRQEMSSPDQYGQRLPLGTGTARFPPDPHIGFLLAISLIALPTPGVLSVMAFHEKAGRSQVDFDLPFLKIHLSS